MSPILEVPEMAAKSLRFDKIQMEIGGTQARASIDLLGRRRALAKLEKESSTRAIFYYAQLHGPLLRTDVLPFANMLSHVGRQTDLDLIIVSPGGDGTAAETMVDLCRKYCDKKLRVVIPAYAKSAATLISLSADEIVMGESSWPAPQKLIQML